MARLPSDLPGKPIATLEPGTVGVVYSVSIVMAIGNTGMQTILPDISAATGLSPFQTAAIYSLSALLWAVCAPFWARQSDIYGRKPMILIGLGGFVVSMLLCSLVIFLGSLRVLPVLAIFVMLLLARALFGMLGAAGPTSSQAYVAERTTPAKRTEAVAGLAGAFGLGTIIGPALAPLFIVPFVRVAGPTLAFAVIALAVLFLVFLRLPETWPPEGREIPAKAERKKFKGEPVWKDPRVRPFLIYGFLVSMCQTAQFQTLGFNIQHTMGEAGHFVAVGMIAGAVAGLFAQWGLIPIFKISPRHLLRWGVALAATANVLMIFLPGYSMIVAAFAVSCIGYGLARPGFSAGASLAVDTKDQARVAGGVASVMGLSVIAAPLFVLAFEFFTPAPYILNTLILIGIIFYVFRSEQLRHAGLLPTTEADTTRAVERNSGSTGF